VAVVQLNAVPGVRKDLRDKTFESDQLFFSHAWPFVVVPMKKAAPKPERLARAGV
jgi:hypothetical protein